MLRCMSRFLRLNWLIPLLCVLAVAQVSAQQRPSPPPPSIPSGNIGMQPGMAPTAVVVSVRGANGAPLDTPAFVKLFSNSMTFNMTSPTRDGSAATFQNVPPGDYNVEVSAPGYKTVSDRVTVFGSGGSYPVYIYIPSESEAAAGTNTPRGTVMSPKLLGEIDKGLAAMRKQQYDTALQHFTRAETLAPANPDVLYLLGNAERALNHTDFARKHYEKALSISPTHEKALLALGEMQIQTGESAAAVTTLEKAFHLNGGDWRTHLLLAYAYFGEKSYEQAQIHAQRAVELAKAQPAAAQVLLGRILAVRGETEAAKKRFAAVIATYPNDASAQEAKQRLTQLEALAARPPAGAAAPAQPQVVLAELPLLPPRPADRAWAPPDIDAKEYHLASDVACSVGDVLARAQKHMVQQIGNFEKFAATEHIVHQEVSANGIPGDPRSKDFWYLVFVRRFEPMGFYLDETRDGDQNLQSFPTSLATTGLVGLGVAILEPAYANDFAYTCEGLSSWRGQAAWQMRFEQRKDMPARVRVWRKGGGGAAFPIPLKGRMWISSTSYDLMRLETDLREPVEKLQLVRDHLTIDYGPVSGEQNKAALWLPWTAEMFMEIRGHRYHHQHTLTNYVFFSVDTKNKIGAPQEPPDPAPPGSN